MVDELKKSKIAMNAARGIKLGGLGLTFLIAVLLSDNKPGVQAAAVPTIVIQQPQTPKITKQVDTVTARIADSLTTQRPGISEIPTNEERNVAVVTEGISKNPEVILTEHQAVAVRAFGKYLVDQGESAIVTSGKRTSDGQLEIIKQRIAEHGALSKFPLIAHATVASTKTWLKAWLWLKAKHVPVNAPANVAGVEGKTSMHLKGLAVDFISSNLDHLRGLLAAFSHSEYAKSAGVSIAAIVREPGCIHINLN